MDRRTNGGLLTKQDFSHGGKSMFRLTTDTLPRDDCPRAVKIFDASAHSSFEGRNRTSVAAKATEYSKTPADLNSAPGAGVAKSTEAE
jgi:hypothetical protein